MSDEMYTLFTKTASQCAPVIMGLKAANLLVIKSRNEKGMKKIFRGSNIEFKKLYSINHTSVYIVFKRDMLQKYVRRKGNLRILFQNQYRDTDLDGMLEMLSARCRKWQKKYNDYPHEIGIFLGYPTKDVKGFIKNKGNNFLYVGYWKVYSNVRKARKTFNAYDRAHEKVMKYFYENAVYGGDDGEDKNLVDFFVSLC